MVSFSACGALWYFSTCFLLMLSRVWKESETGHSSDTKPTANILLNKSRFLVTCVKISLAKTLFPCFIIMLTNLLKKNNMDNSHMTWPPVAKRDQTLSLNPWFYLRTGSLKTELVIPLGAALMGLSAFSSRSSFSSGLNSVMGVLYTSFLTSGSR